MTAITAPSTEPASAYILPGSTWEAGMATWAEFAQQAPALAEAARGLIYQYGVGLGFLATIRPDGGPRLHSICPIIADGGLYAFIVPSPKRADLDRDGRFALHTYSPAEIDDECYLTGTAGRVQDPVVRAIAEAAYHHTPSPEEQLYEFYPDRCMIARYQHRGDWPPQYTTWTEPRLAGRTGQPSAVEG